MADRYTKAVLTVIAVALAWLCLTGLPSKIETPAAAAATPAETASSGVQRYQISYSPISATEVYLLDTQTGRAWQLVNDPPTNSKWWRASPNPTLLLPPGYFVALSPSGE